jgi:hypothetical protein
MALDQCADAGPVGPFAHCLGTIAATWHPEAGKMLAIKHISGAACGQKTYFPRTLLNIHLTVLQDTFMHTDHCRKH